MNSLVGMMFVTAKKTVWNIIQKHHKGRNGEMEHKEKHEDDEVR